MGIPDARVRATTETRQGSKSARKPSRGASPWKPARASPLPPPPRIVRAAARAEVRSFRGSGTPLAEYRMTDRSMLVIGTRGSPLALAQAHETQDRLSGALAWTVEQLPLSIITTTGDAIQDRPLSEAGGKGLFTKELDIALLHGAIDVAVHSAKDLPTALPEGIVIAGYLPREDVRDAFISRRANSLRALPAGAVLGSASLRRQAQVKRLRPDLRVELLRGNVNTRLKKLESGAFDATLLAMAGLSRLGLADHVTSVLDIDDFLPAV